MAKYRITGPDGGTYEVTAPADASEADVLSYVQKNVGSTSSAPPRDLLAEAGIKPGQKLEPPPSRTERFLRGVGDPFMGGAQAVVNALPDSMVSPERKAQFNRGMTENERAYDTRLKGGGVDGIDWWRGGGNFAITAPAMAAIPATTSLLGSAVAAGGTGAVTGALQPVYGDGDYWDKKASQVGDAAAVGAVAGPAMQMGARVVKPQVDRAVQYLTDKGVTPTVGQALGGNWKQAEDKLTSVPILGSMVRNSQRRTFRQFNRAVYDDVLRPLGMKYEGELGRDAVAQVGNKVSKAYDDLLPNVIFRSDQQFATEINNLASLAKGLPNAGHNGLADQFRAFVDDKLVRALQPTGTMDGITFKELESYLTHEVRRLSRATDAYQNKLGDAYATVLQSMRDGLMRSNPQQAEQLGAINRAWAMLTRLEDAASRQGTIDGVFTPSQFSAAVRAGDRSKRHRAFSRGEALMQDMADNGRAVLGDAYPNSGTAGRMLANMAAAGVLGGGAAGGIISPGVLMGMGAASLPYTPWGQKAASVLLTQRPEALAPVAEAMRRSVPATGLLGTYLSQYGVP